MSGILSNLEGKVISDVLVEHFDADKGSIKRVKIVFTDGASLIVRGNIESQGDPYETATYIAALMLEQLGATSFVEKKEIPNITIMGGGGSNY